MNNESDMKRGVSSVKRHYNPSILKETLGKQNIMSDCRHGYHSNCPFCADEELQRQIQSKLEAWKKAEDLQTKLTEIESVLKWASENVWNAAPYSDGFWSVVRKNKARSVHTAPTLYQALWSAWKEREVKS